MRRRIRFGNMVLATPNEGVQADATAENGSA